MHIYILPQCSTTAASVLNSAGMDAQFERSCCAISRGILRRILLFVREFKQDALGTSPYTFLGKATYVSHTGSKPMNIVWKLEKPIPAKYLRRVQQVMG